MNKYTPGPWVAASAGPVMAGYSQGYAVASAQNPTLIAGCFSDVRGGPEVAAANAALIAAAPELLAALRDIVRAYPRPLDGRTPVVVVAAEAAIAKAEGK